MELWPDGTRLAQVNSKQTPNVNKLTSLIIQHHLTTSVTVVQRSSMCTQCMWHFNWSIYY